MCIQKGQVEGEHAEIPPRLESNDVWPARVGLIAFVVIPCIYLYLLYSIFKQLLSRSFLIMERKKGKQHIPLEWLHFPSDSGGGGGICVKDR